MPGTFTVSYQRRGGYKASLGTGQASAGLRFGTSPTGQLVLTAGQVDTGYRNDFTIAAAGTLLIDLLGGAGEKDILNNALSFARLVWLYLELSAPGAGVSVKVGPQGQANAWQGPWGGVAATDLTTVPQLAEWADPSAVWPAVSGTSKVIAITNPSASAVSGMLLLAGLHT